jgi:hypothetical protein
MEFWLVYVPISAISSRMAEEVIRPMKRAVQCSCACITKASAVAAGVAKCVPLTRNER